MAAVVDGVVHRVQQTTEGFRLAERSADDRRLCPTRTSGAHSLIAHWITPATCLERQRRGYHKCFSCSYLGLSVDATLPPPPKPAPVPKLAPAAKEPVEPAAPLPKRAKVPKTA